MEEIETKKVESSNPWSLVATIIIILSLLLGFLFFFRSYNQDSPATSSPAPSPTTESVSGESLDVQSNDTASQVIEIEMEGGGFYYQPGVINAKVGDIIRIKLSSVDMPHDFVIDELDVKSKIVAKGQSTEIEFTVTQPGEFEFYCSVGNHRAMGMTGMLIVTE